MRLINKDELLKITRKREESALEEMRRNAGVTREQNGAYYRERNALSVIVESFPEVDAVEVVRCRDCVYWQDSEIGVVEIPICEREMPKHTGMIGEHFFGIGADGFCSFGKRKDDGSNI